MCNFSIVCIFRRNLPLKIVKNELFTNRSFWCIIINAVGGTNSTALRTTVLSLAEYQAYDTNALRINFRLCLFLWLVCVRIFATFLKKGSAKNFQSGKGVKTLCSHCTHGGKFWSSFFKSLRVWAEPIKRRFFLLSLFLCALCVKEKAA